MENKLTTLNVLEQLVIEHKINSLQLLIGESSKRYTTIHCDIILKMIEELWVDNNFKISETEVLKIVNN